MSIKKEKTSLQKLMGGAAQVTEAFDLPGLSSLSSKNDENEGTEGTKGTKDTITPPAPATPASPATNVIGATPVISTPGNTKQTSNTNAIMTEIQDTTTNNILVFIIHVIFAVIIAYIWGILGSNALFLMTRSKKEKDYIFPSDRYAEPYCNTGNPQKSYFSYGFPYNKTPRNCSNKSEVNRVITTELQNIYIRDKAEEGGIGNGLSHAFKNYIFNTVYGGLGEGMREYSKSFLNIFNTTDTSKEQDQDSWDNMETAGRRKLLIFILFPLILIYLIYGLGFIAGIAGLILGIVSDHPFWGIIFTLVFGFIIAICNGIWGILQSFYIFCFYPCLNIKNKTPYDKIFNNMRPYMLLIFYILIALYAFQDLGNSGGAGIVFFIIIAYFTGNAS